MSETREIRQVTFRRTVGDIWRDEIGFEYRRVNNLVFYPIPTAKPTLMSKIKMVFSRKKK